MEAEMRCARSADPLKQRKDKFMGHMPSEGTHRNLRHPLRNTLSLLFWLLGVFLLAACGSGPTPPANSPDSSLGVYFTGFTTAGVIGPLYALHASDGTLRWKIQVHPDAQVHPLLANGILYLREATGGVSAFKASDGTRLWHQDLGHAVVMNTVAQGVVYGTVVAGLDPIQSSIFALDASSGKVLWESPQAGGTLERVADGSCMWGLPPRVRLMLPASRRSRPAMARCCGTIRCRQST